MGGFNCVNCVHNMYMWTNRSKETGWFDTILQLLLVKDLKKKDSTEDIGLEFKVDPCSMKLLQLFQRLLLSTVYNQSKKDNGMYSNLIC